MTFDSDENTIDSNNDNIDSAQDNNVTKSSQAERNAQARRRIDELMEQKRLKELLDDEEDW